MGLIAVVASLVAATQGAATGHRTGNELWRAADGGFAAWTHDGTAPGRGGGVRLAGEARSGDVVSPVVPTGLPAREAIPSWNAATPPGTWVEARLRARVAGRWTRWYELGSWSSREAARRHSVDGQRDARGRVLTDTLALAGAADALQLGLRLRSARDGASPSVRAAALAWSQAAARPSAHPAGDRSRWATALEVPEYSQMVYPDGGNVWCSPTAVSMVLAYWQRYRGPAEPRVRRTVRGVYDREYRGHGNWAFNVAYAATEGMQARVARFESFRDVERWVDAGVPVVFSFAWARGELRGAAGSSDGHLAVVVGFDRRGNPIVNDPAARSNRAVRRTYPRRTLERLWLQHSGGTVYLIHPPTHRVPQS
ncbi:MAG TPA: peptidase C39 family protein [Gaiellaceae bacterium]|nr:peptidase C39 family protein [Gaiellaceae bacterium]